MTANSIARPPTHKLAVAQPRHLRDQARWLGGNGSSRAAFGANSFA
jgi:hypothetical protein